MNALRRQPYQQYESPELHASCTTTGSVDIFLETIEAAAPGDVMVVDHAGRRDESCVGDLITIEVNQAGLIGPKPKSPFFFASPGLAKTRPDKPACYCGVGVTAGPGVTVPPGSAGRAGSGVTVASGVGVGVAVGSGVTVASGVGVGVAVGSGVTVASGIGVGVAVGSGVTVASGVGVGVAVGSGVTVASGVGVGIVPDLTSFAFSAASVLMANDACLLNRLSIWMAYLSSANALRSPFLRDLIIPARAALRLE